MTYQIQVKNAILGRWATCISYPENQLEEAKKFLKELREYSDGNEYRLVEIVERVIA